MTRYFCIITVQEMVKQWPPSYTFTYTLDNAEHGGHEGMYRYCLASAADEAGWKGYEASANEPTVLYFYATPVDSETHLGEAGHSRPGDLELALTLLAEISGEEPCDYDRHGCHAHGFISLEPGQTCPHQDAAALLARLRPAVDGEATTVPAAPTTGATGTVGERVGAPRHDGGRRADYPTCGHHPETSTSTTDKDADV